MRIFLFLFFICPSAFAGYTTMTIEGVQQANGVWTTAGVMDSMGFVRTTGAVTVMGATRNLPVEFAASAAAKTTFKSVARSLGPYAILAVGALDVYDWYTSTNIDKCPNNEDKFCLKPQPTETYDPATYNVGFFWYYSSLSGGIKIGSTPHQPCNTYAPTMPYYASHTVVVSGSTSAVCKVKNNVNGAFDQYPAERRSCATQPVTGSYTLPSCRGDIVDPYGPQPVYMGDTHFNALPDPSPNVLADGFNKLPQLKTQGVPFDPASTKFTPYSEWLGQPYFKDGSWYRDRMDISPCPTASQPTRVCVDIGPQKFEGSTDPQTIPSQATGTATGSAPKEQADFCKKNPQSIACAELGELEPEAFDPIEKPFQVVAQSPWGSGDASCPAPKVINLHEGGTVTLSYQPACDFFSGVRPAILALAWLAALYIALGIPVGKGD